MIDGRKLYNFTYNNYKQVDCYISKVIKEAYKYKYLISNPAISRNPDSTNLNKNICCHTEVNNKYSKVNIFTKIIHYS